jgi:DNA-binding MarR family transcriptional regulator
MSSTDLLEEPNIGILLRDAFQSLVRQIHDALGEAGFADIRPAHGTVFQFIDGEAGSRLVELADRAQLTKQSMQYLVDHLERAGYVERRADPADARAKRIHLTTKGWEAIPVAVATIARVERHWRDTLGERDYRRLRTLLARLPD